MRNNLCTYLFTGQLYLPDKPSLNITGIFGHDGLSTLEGRMSCAQDERDRIQGNLINGQTYYVPSSEENPRNFLFFAHFSETLPNQHYFLVKNGNEFEGKYSGKMDNSESKQHGVNRQLYRNQLRYADMILNQGFNVKLELRRA